MGLAVRHSTSAESSEKRINGVCGKWSDAVHFLNSLLNDEYSGMQADGNRTELIREESISLVDDLYGGDSRIICDRVKRQVDLPFRGGPQMIESFGERVKAAHFLIYIEVVEQRRAVAIYPEYTASNTDVSGGIRNPIQFGKVEHERVAAAGIDRNGITEMPVPLLGIQLRIGGAAHLPRGI